MVWILDGVNNRAQNTTQNEDKGHPHFLWYYQVSETRWIWPLSGKCLKNAAAIKSQPMGNERGLRSKTTSTKHKVCGAHQVTYLRRIQERKSIHSNHTIDRMCWSMYWWCPLGRRRGSIITRVFLGVGMTPKDKHGIIITPGTRESRWNLWRQQVWMRGKRNVRWR